MGSIHILSAQLFQWEFRTWPHSTVSVVECGSVSTARCGSSLPARLSGTFILLCSCGLAEEQSVVILDRKLITSPFVYLGCELLTSPLSFSTPPPHTFLLESEPTTHLLLHLPSLILLIYHVYIIQSSSPYLVMGITSTTRYPM